MKQLIQPEGIINSNILHLILSPGKSGTQSLEAFLKIKFPNEQIVRIHWISNRTCGFFKKVYEKTKDPSLKTQISLAELTKNKLAKKKYKKIIIYWSCRNPYSTAISSLFQNFNRYQNEFLQCGFRELRKAADFSFLIKTLLKNKMPSSARFKKYVFAKDFFKEEICFIFPWAKKINPKAGVFRSKNEILYILPLEKKLRYLFKLSQISWLNPEKWPKKNVTKNKTYGKLYQKVKLKIKFPKNWTIKIEKIFWYKKIYPTAFRKKLMYFFSNEK